MAERKKTLFHVLKPLLTLLNLLYGLNLGNRKPAGWEKQLRKKVYKHLIWLVFLLSCFIYFGFRIQLQETSTFLRRSDLLINFFSTSFYLFAFNEPEMERLVRRLKRYKIGRMSERVTSKMIKVFLVALALIALSETQTALKLLYLIVKGSVGLYYKEKSLFKTVTYLVEKSLLCLHLSVVLLFLLTALIFPILLSCLCCVLVSYCPSRLDDHVEDILRAHSPLRRATLLSKVCEEYYKLQPLASMTNRNMATTMSLMKIVTMLLWVICIHKIEQGRTEVVTLPILQYSIPLLMYLRVAPPANDMQCKIFTAAAEVLKVDGEWHGHDLISRSLLMKLRLNLLQHLVHIRMDQGPFTLLGDSVDPETLFMIFIEANDLRTTLG